MANTNTVVKQTYACDGVNKDFAIPFFFIEGEESVIKVYLIDDLTLASTLLTLTSDYTLDTPATTVTTIAAYAVGKSIQVKRVSPLIQESEFLQGPFPFEAVEEQFDRVVALIQEASDANSGFLALPLGVEGIELPVPESNKLIGWNAAATALENKSESNLPAVESNLAILTGRVDALEAQDVVTIAKDAQQDGRLDNHDTAITDLETDLNTFSGILVTMGATIANFPAQIEDLQDQIDLINDRGTDVDQLLLDVADHDTRIGDLETEVIDQASRISYLEAASTVSQFSGSCLVLNNQSVPEAIPLFKLDGDGTELASIDVYVRRQTDSEVRFVKIKLAMLYDTGTNTWYIGKESTTIFAGNPEGVEFSVVTNGDKVGQVYYVSDNMAGANYTGELKFLGKEIPTGV